MVKLKSSLRTYSALSVPDDDYSRNASHSLSVISRFYYGRHRDLVNHYGITVSQTTTDMFRLP